MKMKYFAPLVAILGALVLPALAWAAQAASQSLNDDTTQVSFEVDTTWHTVEGKTSGITGRIWREPTDGAGGIRAEVHIPVAKFDTDNASRDEELRSVMDAAHFAEVLLQINSVDPACHPGALVDGGCDGVAQGALTIRGVAREIRLPCHLDKGPQGAKLSGQLSFEWGAFGVEDPSIIIAKVHKDVLVRYACEVKI